jgi:fructose-1,6-bisphosphatase I
MKGMTIERHVLQMERDFPEATGTFSDIIHGIAGAARRIAHEVRRAGLSDLLDEQGIVGTRADAVKKLDRYAHTVLFQALDHRGHLCAMATLKDESILPIPEHHPRGSYCLLFDPLDGSDNLDVNVTVGTVFSIQRKVTGGPSGQLEDCLQPGSRQVAAGYVVYGSSTMFVYTFGAGVYGFTLDPGVGEFLLSHPNMRIPVPGARSYSVDEGLYTLWPDRQRRLVDHLKRSDLPGGSFSARYVGSTVADVHRVLLHGGVFMSPAEKDHPRGRHQLLFEAAPLAMIAQQAGGRASDGVRDILDIEPTELHECTPLYLGSRQWVDLAERYLAGVEAELA